MPNQPEKLHQKFYEVYQQLNENQREAVDTIEGPVMVIAGPGTGKTQILAARIGKILLETDALPENILCLTYTDAGAIAMRRRLQQFIGAEAYRVNIFTFHAFCNEVIQDNLHVFEKQNLEPVSELEKMEMLKQLIETFPKGHPLKRYRGDVYYEIKNLDNLFSVMKKEGWSPNHIQQRVKVYLDELPTRDGFTYKRKYKQFNAGDLKQGKIDEEVKKCDKLLAAADEFTRFQEMMQKRNRYDFDDMINWVIEVFENNPNLLLDYQEKYQYILVDEYQDTSGTQNRIVQLLINYWDEPNVFVVGDDDQSIFRFQGANVENMMELQNNYVNTLKKVVLTDNYRSTQPILDYAGAMITLNQDRLVNRIPGLSKQLTAKNTRISNLSHAPEIREYPVPHQEMAHIALEIEALLQQGVESGKIAVLARQNAHLEELAGYLRLKGIPYFTKRSINLLHQPFLIKIITLLRYFQAEQEISFSGDHHLFQILHYDFYGHPPIDIARLITEANNRSTQGKRFSLRQMMVEAAAAPPVDLFNGGKPEWLPDFANKMEMLISAGVNETLQSFFEKVVQHAGVLTYVMRHPQKVMYLNMLTAFFNFIKSETARNPDLTLQEFLEVINLMHQEKISLPLIYATGNEQSVNLLTAHGSKGLEFTYVFLMGTNAHLWEKKRKPTRGYSLPDTLLNQPSQAGESEELRRLFYVAITRAETHLFISYSRFRTDGKEAEPSSFVAELLDAFPGQPAKIEVPEQDLLFFESMQFAQHAPEIQQTEEDLITVLLQRFTMNVTALNSYLDCPIGFYYKNLLRIPSGKNENMEFGSAVHHALDQLFTKMQNNNTQIFPPVEILIDDFKWYMRRHRESFTREAFKRRMEYGEEILANYYQTYVQQWNKIVSVEKAIRGVVVNGVPLKGKLDKLEFNGNLVNVVDYKTGKVENAKSKLAPPDDKNPLGGDYWRQAVFYKILVDNMPAGKWTVQSTEFDFIEPGDDKKYHKEMIPITPEDTAIVVGQITDTWGKIQNREFYTGCGKQDCEWCNFVKDNQLHVALHQLVEVEE